MRLHDCPGCLHFDPLRACIVYAPPQRVVEGDELQDLQYFRVTHHLLTLLSSSDSAEVAATSDALMALASQSQRTWDAFVAAVESDCRVRGVEMDEFFTAPPP